MTMKRKGWILGFIAMLLLTVTLFGCAANFLNKSAAAVGGAASIYDVGMTIVADFQKAGIINDAQRAQIDKAAEIYLAALKVADEALITYNRALVAYKNAKTDENQQKVSATKAAFSAALSNVGSLWADIAKLVNTIKPGSLPATITTSQVLSEIKWYATAPAMGGRS
jgi:hypothetical protein